MILFHPRNRLVGLIAALGLCSSMMAFAADPPTEAAYLAAEASSIPSAAPSRGAAAQPGLANPASEHCAKLGGTPQIRERPDGGQYGVCVFEDNH